MNTSIARIPGLSALLHGGGTKADVALGLTAGFVGGSQYVFDVASDGRLGGSDALGNAALGVGIGAGALLAARRLPVLLEHNPRGGRLAIAGVLAGAALLATAPLAIADSTAPNLRSKAVGDPTEVPPTVRSVEGVAAPASRPDIIDMRTRTGSEGHVPWSSERSGRFAGEAPNFILLHGTGPGNRPGATKDQTATSLLDDFSNDERPVSAHYVVDRDGKIARYVDPMARAWHASGDGVDWNSASVGIEIVNDNTGSDPYTDAQLEAVRSLVQTLSHDFRIPASHIYAHRQVQDDRRDPVGFPFREFLGALGDTEPLEGRVPGLASVDEPNEPHAGHDTAQPSEPAATPEPSATATATSTPTATPSGPSSPEESPSESTEPVHEAPSHPVESGAPMIDQLPASDVDERGDEDEDPPAAPTKPSAPKRPHTQHVARGAGGSGVGGFVGSLFDFGGGSDAPARPQEASSDDGDGGNAFSWFVDAFG